MVELVCILLAVLGLYLTFLPVRIAVWRSKATRSGIGWCLLAIVGASAIHLLGLLAGSAETPFLTGSVGLLLAAFAFRLILGISYGKGLIIAVVHGLFSFGTLWFFTGGDYEEVGFLQSQGLMLALALLIEMRPQISRSSA